MNSSPIYSGGDLGVMKLNRNNTMRHGHLTDQRKHFVEAYCRLGNVTMASREAGYKDSPSLVN